MRMMPQITRLLLPAATCFLISPAFAQDNMGSTMSGGGMMVTDAPALPPVRGYSDGVEILFVHSETSDPDIAKILTDMMGGSPVLVVPKLAQISPELLAPVYVFHQWHVGRRPHGSVGRAG